jgi:peptidoglycan hydrolase-like protein with peptidoglycan-binding domain
LCLAPDSPEFLAADFGRDTRAAIQSWRSVRGSPAAGPLLPKEITDLLAERPCDRAQYRTAFEKFNYGSQAKIVGLQKALAATLGGSQPVPETGKFDDATRAAISALQRLKNQPETGTMTRQLAEAMVQ